MAVARSISQEDVHESSMTNGASGEDKALHNRQTCVRKEMVHLGKIRHCMSDKRACAWNLCHALYMRLLRHTVKSFVNWHSHGYTHARTSTARCSYIHMPVQRDKQVTGYEVIHFKREVLLRKGVQKFRNVNAEQFSTMQTAQIRLPTRLCNWSL